MANFGFGLDTNNNAQSSGFDLYKKSFEDIVPSIAKDTWNFSPLYSIYKSGELFSNRNDFNTIGSQETDQYNQSTTDFQPVEPLISPEELNKKYAGVGLLFEQPEKQSTVNLLLDRKYREKERQDIISRGPQGVLPGAAKIAVSFGVGALDPINLASAFIPVVGEARFAAMAARTNLTTARLATGMVEGAVGAAVVEPIVYGAAQYEQADYGLMDSFMNVGFGTVLGGGLHIGAGALKDLKTNLEFKAMVRDARTASGITDGADPALNLYKEYYPENSSLMRQLAETDPETRSLLLARALTNLMEGDAANVVPIANLDPKLREAQINDAVSNNNKVDVNKVQDNTFDSPRSVTEERSSVNQTRKEDQIYVDTVDNNLRLPTPEKTNLNLENKTLDDQLNVLKDRQKDLNIEDSAELKAAKTDSEQVDTKQKELKDAIADGIDCVNGR
jgi:hypothetical protein